MWETMSPQGNRCRRHKKTKHNHYNRNPQRKRCRKKLHRSNQRYQKDTVQVQRSLPHRSCMIKERAKFIVWAKFGD